jgi:hypothetical protein
MLDVVNDALKVAITQEKEEWLEGPLQWILQLAAEEHWQSFVQTHSAKILQLILQAFTFAQTKKTLELLLETLEMVFLASSIQTLPSVAQRCAKDLVALLQANQSQAKLLIVCEAMNMALESFANSFSKPVIKQLAKVCFQSFKLNATPAVVTDKKGKKDIDSDDNGSMSGEEESEGDDSENDEDNEEIEDDDPRPKILSLQASMMGLISGTKHGNGFIHRYFIELMTTSFLEFSENGWDEDAVRNYCSAFTMLAQHVPGLLSKDAQDLLEKILELGVEDYYFLAPSLLTLAAALAGLLPMKKDELSSTIPAVVRLFQTALDQHPSEIELSSLKDALESFLKLAPNTESLLLIKPSLVSTSLQKENKNPGKQEQLS